MSIGTKTDCEQRDAIMPATPFAIAACTGSDSLNGSTILNAATLVVSSAVRNIILAGIAPVMTVPKPLYKPGMPSFRTRPLTTENALSFAALLVATCILVLITEMGYSATVSPVNIPAPTT